ncbi:SDR family oxidoreductase [Novosphingobium colocasiae]|uniref:Dehydrogenase n=1 Tax=Novosphingobium colocasiae TaxID=1256513 RepID=A0A918UK89_9SPHN|nr:SDR family oxidoreductase [Novosphingobium colocasiae]GGZ16400.1 dehydrogenase [Novosphingobium colocasiae]
MEFQGKIIVVTGAASGIGRALAQRFAAEGAKAVVCADLNAAGAGDAAAAIGATATGYGVDVSKEDEIARLIETVERDIGPIDLFCSNAGIYSKNVGVLAGDGGGADTAWQRSWDINVMAHVWAARHLAPRMIARGGGYLLNTSSAGGLLSEIGSAPYAVTKHAAVGLAEWLAITLGDDGIKVSVLCPQLVRSAMTAGVADGNTPFDGMMEPEELAEITVRSLEREDFLILPHPQVLDYMRNKTSDYGRWIGGMRKLYRRLRG